MFASISNVLWGGLGASVRSKGVDDCVSRPSLFKELTPFSGVSTTFRSMSTSAIAPLSPAAIKDALSKGTIDIPDTEQGIIDKVNELKAEQDKVFEAVTGRTRRDQHVDAPTPYHIPEYLKLEADVVRLQKALPGKWHTVVTVNRGLSNRYAAKAAHDRGLNAVLIGTPAECKTAVNDGFDYIIPIESIDYMNGEALLAYVHQHVESLDPREIAINPGIAFLSEQSVFSGQVERAGYSYMGGGEATIDSVGNKTNSKDLALDAWNAMTAEQQAAFGQIPVIQSVSTADVPREEWLTLARKTMEEVRGPILMKNAFGGGGRGIEFLYPDMTDEEILEVFQQQDLTGKTFGNTTNYLFEKYISESSKPRHIEVQILENNVVIKVGGQTLIVDMRDCSDQYKMAKMLEKTALDLDPQTRQNISVFCEKFVDVVTTKYGSVFIGTIEFLVDNTGDIFFMEMNTRLQIEHQVSALIVAYAQSHGRVLSREEATTLVIGGLMDASRGVQFDPLLLSHDSSEEPKKVVRQARIYGMRDDNQAPYVGTVQVTGQDDAEAVPGVFTNFVNHDKPYSILPSFNTQFGEISVVADTVEEANANLKAGLEALNVVEGETNIPLLLYLLEHPEMEGNPDIHTMGKIIEERQALFVEAKSLTDKENELADIAEKEAQIQREKLELRATVDKMRKTLPVWTQPRRGMATLARPYSVAATGFNGAVGRPLVSQPAFKAARVALGVARRVFK